MSAALPSGILLPNSSHGTNHVRCAKGVEDAMLDDKEIVAAYQTVLGREPDPQGFETFRELGRQGLTVGELRDLLEGSDELRARRVAALFALAYGRAADAYELDQLNAYVAQVGATSGRDLLKA